MTPEDTSKPPTRTVRITVDEDHPVVHLDVPAKVHIGELPSLIEALIEARKEIDRRWR